MSFLSTADILTRLGRFGIHPGLDRMRRALDLLGHPEKGPVTFQIVGTNGKGSTAAAIDAILISAGYRTGRYTSPHLSDVRERILISGQMVATSLFEELVRDVDSLCRRHQLVLTFFEFLTVVSFLAFSRTRCEVLVLEAGLGGRWDATTASNPILTVLTQVGRDHEEILGQGIEKIYEEKVAVGREGRPFVATLHDPSLRERFLGRSGGVRFIPLLNGRDFDGVWTAPDNLTGNPRPFHYRGRWGNRNLASTLSASYQIENLSCAIAALEWSPLPVPHHSFREGLLTLENPGRLETVMKNPTVLLDGAHNPPAIQALCRALRDRFGSLAEFGFFLAIHSVKDWMEMLRILAPEGNAFFFTESPDGGMPPPSAVGAWASPSQMARTLREWSTAISRSCEIREGGWDALLGEAMDWAKAKETRILVVTGSLYLVGAIRTFFHPPSDPPLFSSNERDLPGTILS